MTLLLINYYRQCFLSMSMFALYWVTYLRRGLSKEPEQGFLF